jgi:hypothetical protein
MDFLMGPLVCGIIFYFTYMVFELFVRKNERQTIIERMGQNMTPIDSNILKNQFDSLLPTIPKRSFTSLKLGCLFLGIGFGLLVGLFLCLYISRYDYDNWREREFHSVAYGASVLLFGGAGLLISYGIERHSTNSVEKRNVNN